MSKTRKTAEVAFEPRSPNVRTVTNKRRFVAICDYTKAAEASNGENVLVNWNNPKLADVHLKDWKRHWEHGESVAARY